MYYIYVEQRRRISFLFYFYFFISFRLPFVMCEWVCAVYVCDVCYFSLRLRWLKIVDVHTQHTHTSISFSFLSWFSYSSHSNSTVSKIVENYGSATELELRTWVYFDWNCKVNVEGRTEESGEQKRNNRKRTKRESEGEREREVEEMGVYGNWSEEASTLKTPVRWKWIHNTRHICRIRRIIIIILKKSATKIRIRRKRRRRKKTEEKKKEKSFEFK